MTSRRWRWLDSGAADGVTQMAVDAALMDRARTHNEAVLRVYAWSEPTLSFGRHETVRGRFSESTLAARGVRAVRRATGGRVLLHDHEVTYSVTAPTDDDAPLPSTYAAINALLLDALRLLGVAATVAPGGAPLRPGDATCFAEPSAGELVVGDRKLVGSAQVRERGALLQHGSILLADDQPRIAELADAPMTGSAPAATLSGAMSRTPSYDEVRDALWSAASTRFGVIEPLDPRELDVAVATHRERFASPEWTWRR